MVDLEIIIKALKSPDLEQRYRACTSLKDLEQLSPEAVIALQDAATDPEPLVSATAEMALLRHEFRLDDQNTMIDTLPDIQPRYTTRELITGLALSVVNVLLTIPLINIIRDDRLNDLWFLSLPTVLIAGYITYLSYQDGQQRPILAVLSSLAIGLLSSIIIYLLLSGMFLMAVSAYFGNN